MKLPRDPVERRYRIEALRDGRTNSAPSRGAA